MTAREVMRLYDIRWLTEEQAKSRLDPGELVALDNERRDEYPWTHLKLEKPTGSPDEVISALRLHIKRTYPRRQLYLDEYDVIHTESDIKDHPKSLLGDDTPRQHIRLRSRSWNENGTEDSDVEMVDKTDDSRFVTKRFHTGDYSSSMEDGEGTRRPHPKRQKFSLDDSVSSPVRDPGPLHPHVAYSGVNTDSKDSFSNNGYPTPLHSPSLPGSSAIAPAVDSNVNIVPSQTRSPW